MISFLSKVSLSEEFETSAFLIPHQFFILLFNDSIRGSLKNWDMTLNLKIFFPLLTLVDLSFQLSNFLFFRMSWRFIFLVLRHQNVIFSMRAWCKDQIRLCKSLWIKTLWSLVQSYRLNIPNLRLGSSCLLEQRFLKFSVASL